MAFPLTPLGLAVELDMNGWTDISSDVYQRDGGAAIPVITRGRANEQSNSPSPTSVAMQWNNRSGQFSPRNPTGQYYGLIGRNTPVRLSVPAAVSYLRIADDAVSYASCPGSAGLAIGGDIDVRLDMNLDNWAPCFLAGEWASGATNWALTLNGNGTACWSWYDGTQVNSVSSTMPVPLGRSAVRCYFDPAGTSGSPQVIFYTAATMGGSFAQLGNAVPITSADYAHAATTPLAVGYSAAWYSSYGQAGLQGAVFELQLYSAATLVADPQFYAQSAGTGGFSDGQGNAWSFSGSAAISSRAFRAHAECTTLPQRWDNTGTDIWTPVGATGVLRRLQQGSSPVRSAMRRGIAGLGPSAGVLAYWPCEDSQGSTQIASGLPGGQPMQVQGAAGFQGQAGSKSADTQFPCSAQLAQVQSSQWNGIVPGGSAAYLANQTVQVLALIEVPTGTSGLTLLMEAGSLALFWSGTALELYVAGTLAAISPAAGGVPLAVLLTAPAAGGGTMATLAAGNPAGTQSVASGAGAATAVANVYVNPLAASFGSTEVGHILVFTGTIPGTTPAGFSASTAINSTIASWAAAWAGETAGSRVLRLCAENGIAGRVYGYPALTAAMGPQPIDTLENLFQYCEDADRGQIYEPTEALGLGYRTLGSLCAQGAGLVLNYAAGHLGDGTALLEPTDDDSYTLNDETLSRNLGSSAQVQVTSGPMSVQPPPDGVGDYDSQLTLYNAWDKDLPNIAGWMTSVGTCDEERWPAIPLNLARPQLASLQAAIAGMRLGDHFQIQNLLGQVAPGTVDQLLWGYTEKLGGNVWAMTLNAVPEDPFAVAVAGAAHAASAGSQLHAAVSATSIALAVDTTAGQPWTTSGADFPFGLMIGGEEVTATSATAGGIWLTGNDAQFTSGLGGWAALSGCTASWVTSPSYYGTGAMELFSTSTAAMFATCPTQSEIMPVTPGDVVTVTAEFIAASVAETCKTRVYWLTSSGGALSNAPAGTGTDSTFGYTQISGSATAPAGAAYAVAGVEVAAAGGAGEVHYVGAVQMANQAGSQKIIVTRGANGVSKAQAAGTAVQVWPLPPGALAGNH